MDTSNWNLYYKIHETENILTTTQMCYEPKVNPERNIFCMDFCYPSAYQINQLRVTYTKELVDYMFDREVKYLETFKNEIFSPEIIDITDKKIFFKWYGKTCNESIYKYTDLKSSWLQDITSIINKQYDLGYIKATVYPHSHYYDNDGVMHAFDYYATVDRTNPFIEYKIVEGMTGLDTDRFNLAIEENLLNIESIFKSGLLTYSKWPQDLTSIYNLIYK
jgi:hypothetical protein